MTTCTLFSPRIENVVPHVIEERDVEKLDGRIHNVFHADIGDGDVILLTCVFEHVDLIESGRSVIAGNYVGIGQGGLPRYVVTEAYPD